MYPFGDAMEVESTESTAPPPVQHLQINTAYPNVQQVPNTDPPIFVVDNFLSPEECATLQDSARSWMHRAPVVGKGIGVSSHARTSTTCFLDRDKFPEIMGKVSALTNKPIDDFEYPQVGRYANTQRCVSLIASCHMLTQHVTMYISALSRYDLHFDAFETETEVGKGHLMNGGQRVCTCLMYLNTPSSGGCTYFRNFDLRIKPEQGRAVIFFPGTLDGACPSPPPHPPHVLTPIVV
jgi:prolyl 4-hydroxylase